MRKVTILTIDGGGIRGIIPAIILAELEKKLQAKSQDPHARLSDFFDMIAGTSTGGILACFYLHPNRFAAEDAIALYRDNAKAIFKKKKVSLGGILDEKYEHKGFEKILKSKFGDAKLSDIQKNGKHCLITSYDMENREAVLFSATDPQGKIPRDFYLRDIARATSAAPIYFEPADIIPIYFKPADIISLKNHFYLLDGGLYANNPAMCAWVEAHKIDFKFIKKPSIDDMYIVSIGTGKVKKKIDYKKTKDNGIFLWMEPLIDILLSASAEVVHYQMDKLFNKKSSCHGDVCAYKRLEPSLFHASPEMDDVRKENLENLEKDALRYVEKHNDDLDAVAKRLIENYNLK